MTNRIKGLDPIYFLQGITFNTEEREYLRQLARSRHPFYRDLCRDYLDVGKDKKRNWKLILELVGPLAADKNENVSGQSLILLERFSQELSPELAWPIVLKLCSSPDSDFRSYAAIVLLEDSVDQHFDFYFPRIKEEVEKGNRNLVDALSHCYFTHYTQDQVQQFDELFTQYLDKERLAEWKKDLPFYLGIRKHMRGKKTDLSWLQPAPGVNRLVGRDPDDFYHHRIELNQIEKEYLNHLAKSSLFVEKKLCLGFTEVFMKGPKNRSLITQLLDMLMSDKDPEVSGSAIMLLVYFHNWGHQKKTWKLVVKYGSSPSRITRELIALGPLESLFMNHEKTLAQVAQEVEKGNRLLLDTLTRCWFFAPRKRDLDAVDTFFSAWLKGAALRRWKAWVKRYQKATRHMRE